MLPIPLFDRNRGEVARATAEREAAEFELAAQQRAVQAEVSGAFQAARLLTERATALAAGDSLPSGAGRATAVAYLARADEARRIALGTYREGAVSLLQVLDAARARGDARLAFFRTLFAQHQSVFALLAAEGIDVSTGRDGLRTPGDVDRAGHTTSPR
jgi:outer membrane protein TolC